MTNQNKEPYQPPTLVRLGKDEPAGIRKQSYMWTCPLDDLVHTIEALENYKSRHELPPDYAQTLSDLRFTLYHRRKDKSS